MFVGQNTGMTQRFIARLSAAFDQQGLSPQGRVKLLPFMTHDDFKRVNILCDVMLDTLHWSGGNTSLDALAVGLPIVTLPGEFMRGRQTMAMLSLLDADELIASSTDDYLAIARRVATDKNYREQVSRKILAGANRLFNDPTPTRALGEILQRLARDESETPVPHRAQPQQ
jgi:CRISPR-associated protein Csy1